jgi:pimeloyl-ACP methyl ester carboxylesterase
MSRETSPFDPQEFAEWLIQGLKENLEIKVRSALDRDRWLEFVKARIPNKNQVIHLALKKAFLGAGFKFEDFQQGDARFHLIRRTFRIPPLGKPLRRLVLIPGFGDSPGSWLPLFTFCKEEIAKDFDEILVMDFPGYLGFLSDHDLVASMDLLIGAVKSVVNANPPEVLIGHSLGGWLAAKAAQETSSTMGHLILLAPSGLMDEEERQGFGDFIVKNQDLTIQELLELVVYDPVRFAPLLSGEFRDFYRQRGVKEFVDSVKPSHFIDSRRPIRARKTTVIWGDHDRFVPTHWIRHWIERYGDTLDAYLLENTGHVPQMECPLRTARVLTHAWAGKGGVSGRGWKKIQSRNREFEQGIRTEAMKRISYSGS